nr:ribonuclease H [Ipomoea batatas]
MCLNVDGSLDAEGTAGCGGALRNHNGEWLGGFMQAFHTTHAIEAEVWAIVKGLEWAWKKDVRHLIIQSDSKEAVDWINGRDTPRGHIQMLVEEGHSWMKKDWDIQVHHVLREQNMVADSIAKMARHTVGSFNDIRDPPQRILNLIEDDRLGRTWQRRGSERNL